MVVRCYQHTREFTCNWHLNEFSSDVSVLSSNSSRAKNQDRFTTIQLVLHLERNKMRVSTYFEWYYIYVQSITVFNSCSTFKCL